MDAIAELESRRRALAHEAKAHILRRLRGELDVVQLTDIATELQRRGEQIEAELVAARYGHGPDDPDGSGGVREPVRPRPPSRGPGIAVVPPRE
jgi:hypothetical protein